MLQPFAGSRPQVAALLKFLPAAQTPINRNATFSLGGQTFVVPLGSITGSAEQFYTSDQVSGRHRPEIGSNHNLTLAT